MKSKKKIKWSTIRPEKARELMNKFKKKYLFQIAIMLIVAIIFAIRALTIFPYVFEETLKKSPNSEATILITITLITFIPLFILFRAILKRIIFLIANATSHAKVATIEEAGLEFVPNKEDKSHIHVKNSKREYKIKYLSGDASIIKNSKKLNILLPNKLFINNMYIFKND